MNEQDSVASAPEPDPASRGRGDRRTGGVGRVGRHRNRLAALPWRLACVLAAALTAGAGWLVVLAYCSLAWLSAGAQGSFEQVLAFAAHAWLLANGVPFVLDGVTVSLVPLGFTALVVVMVCSLTSVIARGAGHSAELDRRARGAAGRRANFGAAAQGSRGSLAARLAGWFAVSYTAILALTVNLLGRPEDTGRAIVGGLVIGGLFALLAAGRTLRWRLVGLSHGGWTCGLAAGVCAAFATLVFAGAVLFVVALLHNRHDVIGLHQQLGAGVFGGLLLSLAQAMWVPNAVLWSVSWLLGAGFTLGTTTSFSPTLDQLGVLPAVPLFGAAPSGAASSLGLFWLLVPALAGAVGGIVAARARRDEGARLLPPVAVGQDGAALLGLVVGICTGVLVCLVQVFARGSLGGSQLVGLGARMRPLLVLAPTVLGAGAMIGSWLFVMLGGRRAGAEQDAHRRGSSRA